MLQWRGYRETLDPAFSALVQNMLGPLPYIYVVTSGIRSMADQQALWQQGRTTPGAIVTNAEAGESPHNYGLAADIYPMVGGIVDFGDPQLSASAMPAWNALWKAIDAEPLLSSGKVFSIGGHPDYGHVQLRNWRAVADQMDVYIPEPPAEGGQTPTWDWGWGGDTTESDAPLGEAPAGSGGRSWFELSPAAAVAGVVVLGIAWYAWTQHRRSRRRLAIAA